MLVFDVKTIVLNATFCLGMLNLMQMQNLEKKNPYYPMLG